MGVEGPEPLTQGLTIKSAGVPSPTRPERAGSQWEEGRFRGEMIGAVPLNSCVTLDRIPTFLSLSLIFIHRGNHVSPSRSLWGLTPMEFRMCTVNGSVFYGQQEAKGAKFKGLGKEFIL